MLNRLLPRQADNAYRGYRLALWVFGLLVLLRTIMSVNSIINGRDIASSADGIPLDTYTAAGAQTVVSLFAMIGLSNLMICILCIVVLVRYRALVPLMFSLLLLHHLARKVIHQLLPIATTGTSPASVINLVLLSLMVAGLVLSLISPSKDRHPARAE
ncbi:MAG TPA: hypothetical protein VFF17_14795 [Thermoanaerobaculia bacterium]|nr:hypothetical protein [Thermoanaerobaculia bacterium]